jgi:hypothetical protein
MTSAPNATPATTPRVTDQGVGPSVDARDGASVSCRAEASGEDGGYGERGAA